MTAFFQSLAFGTPLALYGLLALPVIWWLLRFTPPRPRPQAFPPVRILLDLPRQDETPDKTPWWLLLLRLLLAALVIFLVAQPFLQPRGADGLPQGQRLVIVDDGWAAAQNWPDTRRALLEFLDDAAADGSQVILAGTAPRAQAVELAPEAARATLERARIMTPVPQSTGRTAALAKIAAAKLSGTTGIVWLSDGLDATSAQSFAEGLTALFPSARFTVFAANAQRLPLALGQPNLTQNEIAVSLLAPSGTAPGEATLSVRATNGRVLLDVPVKVDPGSAAQARFTLPTALRNEIQSISVAGQNHAGAKQLLDDRWRRRTIAMLATESREQAQPLLSPLHYVSRGLEPYAELFQPETDADLAALIDGGLSMLVLADVGRLPEEITPRVNDWIEKGGVLLRFAGPRLAAGHDNLVPVQLREGDRTLGSALSWETPQTLQDFPQSSPFAGLVIDPRITVSRQVLAEPDADLASRTWASLADGTPLVTAQQRGKGLIVLFHVTANANWSNLPLSGLFVDMMSRVAGLDPSQQTQAADASQPAAFTPRLVMTGEGDLVAPDGSARSIPAADFPATKVSALHPPGLYAQGGKEQALNLSLTAADLAPMPTTLAGQPVRDFSPQPKTSLVPPLAIAALLLFLLDCLATVWIGGGWRRLGTVTATAAAIFLVFSTGSDNAMAQDMNMEAALGARLAYVKTGNDEVDRISQEGLAGLTLILSDRTSANLAAPFGVSPESDDLTFYPLLYWPVVDEAESLGETTRAKVSGYLKNGGTIFFDLRSGGVDTDGSSNTALRRILDKLDVPPLEPVPEKHVLTRSFYLLSDYPGRYEGGPLWVEANLGDTNRDPGTADGVSAIIIGSNDYAAAWALDQTGNPLYAVVPGSDRQREFAFRTGINIVMYALTGNYKADQVHVPALLERLGQ